MMYSPTRFCPAGRRESNRADFMTYGYFGARCNFAIGWRAFEAFLPPPGRTLCLASTPAHGTANIPVSGITMARALRARQKALGIRKPPLVIAPGTPGAGF